MFFANKSGLGGHYVARNDIPMRVLQNFFLISLFSVLWHTSLTKMIFQSGLKKSNEEVDGQMNTAPRITNCLTTLST